MKAFIAAIVAVVAIAIPTMIGFIPAFLGVPAMLGIVIIKDVIFLVLARGLPMAIIAVRSAGGFLWGIMEKTGNIIVGRKRSVGGMVFTQKNGAFNVVSEGMVRLDGVPFFLAPEEVGHNVKLEHLQLLKELKSRGIHNILEVIDVNEQKQFVGWRDDPRIRDLKEKYTTLPQLIYLPGLNDFHRYVTESVHPFRQDANIKIGIAQGTGRVKESRAWMWVAVIAIIGVIAMAALFILKGGGGEVKVIIENAAASKPIIPA